MYQFYLTFRSMTRAQSAAAALLRNGIAAAFMRAPKSLSAQGCGYALQLDGANLQAAALVLRREGLFFEHAYRVYPGQPLWEVPL